MSTRWYIVHAYSNFENKVAQSIKDQAAQRNLADIRQVTVEGVYSATIRPVILWSARSDPRASRAGQATVWLQEPQPAGARERLRRSVASVGSVA